jgi:hypothetical protein
MPCTCNKNKNAQLGKITIRFEGKWTFGQNNLTETVYQKDLGAWKPILKPEMSVNEITDWGARFGSITWPAMIKRPTLILSLDFDQVTPSRWKVSDNAFSNSIFLNTFFYYLIWIIQKVLEEIKVTLSNKYFFKVFRMICTYLWFI